MENFTENTTKGRKFCLLSLTCCRILAADALLIMLPVFFNSCSTDETFMHEIPVEIKRAIYGNMHEMKSMDIFIFNDDALRRLDSYQRVAYDGQEKIVAASRKGKKIIAAIANSSVDKAGWSGINSLDALLSMTANLQDEDPANPVMCGIAYAEMGTDRTCTMTMQPLISEIYIRSIRCDFSGMPYSGETLRDVRIYLTNVNACAHIFGQSDFMPLQIVNAGRLSDNDLEMFLHPEMVIRNLDGPVGDAVVRPEIFLNCYPNDCRDESPGSPFTRLVIEGKVSGHTYYYPIDINRGTSQSGTGIGRNSRYAYDITITRTGTKDPDLTADPDMMDIHCSTLPWSESGEDEISF